MFSVVTLGETKHGSSGGRWIQLTRKRRPTSGIGALFAHLLTLDDAISLGRHLRRAVPDQGEVVALAKILFEEERGAAAAQLAVGDDGDAVAQDVRLIHVVRGQDDGAACREAKIEARSASATPKIV